MQESGPQTLNLVERCLAELTTKWIKRGTDRSVHQLVASIRSWIAGWNDNPKPYVWHKTADEMLDSLAVPCARESPTQVTRDTRAGHRWLPSMTDP